MDETSIARLWPFLWPSGESRTPHDPDAIRARINANRARKGLPPMQAKKR